MCLRRIARNSRRQLAQRSHDLVFAQPQNFGLRDGLLKGLQNAVPAFVPAELRQYEVRVLTLHSSEIGGRVSAFISECEELQDFTAPVWTSLRDCFYPAKFRLVSILSLAAFRSAHGEHDQELDELPLPCYSNAG
jgi:hypothetical protein